MKILLINEFSILRNEFEFHSVWFFVSLVFLNRTAEWMPGQVIDNATLHGIHMLLSILFDMIWLMFDDLFH